MSPKRPLSPSRAGIAPDLFARDLEGSRDRDCHRVARDNRLGISAQQIRSGISQHVFPDPRA